jgi:glycosyltransferase involved in cell wall biosynthesis
MATVLAVTVSTHFSFIKTRPKFVNRDVRLRNWILTMNTIHIVTPVYCTEENQRLWMLLQTIQSVQQQSWSNYLHIIVDDGSTGEIPAILDRIAANDPRLVVFHKTNGGSSAAINHGVERSRAYGTPRYITICHSDDLLLPESLRTRVDLAIRTGSKLVYSDAVLINDERMLPGIHQARPHATAHELYAALLNQGAGIPYLTMLWDADFFMNTLQGYDERLTSSEDWDMALRSAKALVKNNGLFAVERSITAAKRSHDGCLRIQNMRDGTKARCYKLILGKHLSGNALDTAMERARRTRLAGPGLSQRIKTYIRSAQRPQLVRGSVQMSRQILNALRMRQARTLLGLRKENLGATTIDADTEAFLRKMKQFVPAQFLQDATEIDRRAA